MASMKSWAATMTIKTANPTWSGASGVRSRKRTPTPSPQHGPDDQWRQSQELVEAARDVTGCACDAGEQNDDQARGDSGLQAKSEAQNEQGNYHYPASCSCEAGESPDPAPARRTSGGWSLGRVDVRSERPRAAIG